jgi:hypothetical protein
VIVAKETIYHNHNSEEVDNKFAKNKGMTVRGQVTGTALQLPKVTLSCMHLTPQLQVCLCNKVPSRCDCLGMQSNQLLESVRYKTPGAGPIGKRVNPGRHALNEGRQWCFESKDAWEGHLGCSWDRFHRCWKNSGRVSNGVVG